MQGTVFCLFLPPYIRCSLKDYKLAIRRLNDANESLDNIFILGIRRDSKSIKPNEEVELEGIECQFPVVKIIEVLDERDNNSKFLNLQSKA